MGALARGETRLITGEEGGDEAFWAGAFIPFLERHGRRAGIALQRHATGLEAARALAKAPADGTAIGAALLPSLVARAVEAGEVPLLRGLRPAGALARAPLVLVAAPGQRLAALRDRAERGLLAVPPPGSLAALVAPELAAVWPLDPLSFPTAAAAWQAAASGHAAAALLPLPQAITPIREERLVALALAEPEDIPLLPEVPALPRLGVPLVAAGYRALLLPPGTPGAVLEDLGRVMGAILADPEFQDQAAELGYVPGLLDATACAALLEGWSTRLQQAWARQNWPRRDTGPLSQ